MNKMVWLITAIDPVGRIREGIYSDISDVDRVELRWQRLGFTNIRIVPTVLWPAGTEAL